MVLQSVNEIPDVSQNKLYNRFLIFQITFPLLGGFLFGYNTGVISGALLLLQKDFNLSVFTQEALVSATVIAATISCVISGIFAEKFGRKITLIASSMLSIIGSLIMGISSSIIFIILGRVIVGLGIGVSAMVCPIYIAEVAPEQVRGQLIVLFQITLAGGQFFASIVNALFYYSSESEIWRYMLGFSAVPAFFQAFGLVFIPESHRWLLSKNKINKAKKIIRKEGRIEEEYIDHYVDNIISWNEATKLPIKNQNLKYSNKINQIIHDKVALKSLFIGCGLQMIQQLIGINGVIYYSSSILLMTGIVEVQNVLWFTVLVMFFCFSPLIIGFFLIDRIGRRKLAIGSLIGIVLSTIILAIGFQVMYETSDAVTNRIPTISSLDNIACFDKVNCEGCVTIHTCGFCSVHNSSSTYCLTVDPKYSNRSVDEYCAINTKNTTFNVGYCKPHYPAIIIVGMLLYLLSFAVGMGPVPWAVTSEIYPLWCRELNMAFSSTINWSFNILISMTFLSLTEWISRYGTFWLYSCISFCSIGFIYNFLPETNQLTLEEVTKLIEIY